MTATVLIAEDEPSIVDALSFLLEREGFGVSVVMNGDAVLDRVRAEQPGVLILDVMMPNQNGFEILKALKADAALAKVPVLLLTAKGQAQDRSTAQDLGADAFITKPFANKEVIDCVKHLARLGSPRAGRS